MDHYAIVIYEKLLPRTVVVFPARNLRAVGIEPGKRHQNLEQTLQFTARNYRQICDNAGGVQVFQTDEIIR